eukprot:2564250-Amphidinium_carterae.1
MGFGTTSPIIFQFDPILPFWGFGGSWDLRIPTKEPDFQGIDVGGKLKVFVGWDWQVWSSSMMPFWPNPTPA